MRHLSSDQLADFSAIYNDDVELITVTRPRSAPLDDLTDALASRQVVQAQWEHAAGDTDAVKRALPVAGNDETLQELSEEVNGAAELLVELLDCARVGIRLTTLNAPMCPRFHADRIPCRMLVTFSGPCTEWIPSDDVDHVALADRATDAPPVRAGGAIRQLTPGGWSLLKGGAWNTGFRGVVHRSPHQAGQRLLLSMDPIFSR